MKKQEFNKQIKIINKNWDNPHVVKNIFSEIQRHELTTDFIAEVFALNKPDFFLLNTIKYWRGLNYNDWKYIIAKKKDDLGELEKIICFFYSFLSVNILPLLLYEMDLNFQFKQAIYDKFYDKAESKIKIGISLLFSSNFLLRGSVLLSQYKINLTKIKLYGQKLVQQGAVTRKITEEKVVLENKLAKISFEKLLEDTANEDLKSRFYECPVVYGNPRLIIEIFNHARESLVRDFLEEHPYLRRIVSDIDKKWAYVN